MKSVTMHLIFNAHLDPVWLWDWREGLNEGISTCRTILDLMDEFPDLTFIRGEAAVYEYIERHDPQTFARIRKQVAAGRWDVVGGTYIQPDTNMPATETLARHFMRGQRYFTEKFGKPVRVAWAADSFGHSGGLPDVMVEAGITGFSFTRPAGNAVPITKPAFWWEGVGGARVLAYRPEAGWYGCERGELMGKMDALLKNAADTGMETVGCYLGLGNHGGGPSRRHLREVQEWIAKHPKVRVVWSGLHKFFDALRAEIQRKGESFLEVHRGEMNYCLRGCYASMAKFKFSYRQLEARAARTERTATAINAMAGIKMPESLSAESMQGTWDTVLFNSFHDILPGSSMERAYDDQLRWLGYGFHKAQLVEADALNALAARVDTTVRNVAEDKPTAVPFLVWNPHPYAYRGHVELETGLDFRPIWEYKGRSNEVPIEVLGADRKRLTYQTIASENTFIEDYPWRKRLLVPVTLPAFGWNVISMGYQEGTPLPRWSRLNLPVKAKVGAKNIRLWNRLNLSLITVDDPWGSWGGMGEEPKSLDLSDVVQSWKVSNIHELETGPERASLWVQFTGGKSRVELTISQYRNRSAIDFKARVFWNERSARLKLVLSGIKVKTAQFDVLGGAVSRGPAGETPGGRWVAVKAGQGNGGNFGFASDALYNFDIKDDTLRATICRATRYSTDVVAPADYQPWLPAADTGELRFNFLLTQKLDDLRRLAIELEEPVIAQSVPAKPGPLARKGSLLELAPDSLRLLALKPAEDNRGIVIRLQETAGRSQVARIKWQGKTIKLGPVKANQIATWKISEGRAQRVTLMETAMP